jgi:hypothetical protein
MLHIYKYKYIFFFFEKFQKDETHCQWLNKEINRSKRIMYSVTFLIWQNSQLKIGSYSISIPIFAVKNQQNVMTCDSRRGIKVAHNWDTGDLFNEFYSRYLATRYYVFQQIIDTLYSKLPALYFLLFLCAEAKSFADCIKHQ